MACGWEDSTPFLVVAGAGHSPVDGRYAQDGFREGKPKFKKVGGEFIIFFRWGMWKLGAEDDTNVWIYESPTDLRPSPMPPSAWVTAGQSKYSPAPSLSLGTCRDLQEGDVVTIIKLHEEVDWSGCPENTARRLALTSTPWTVTIHRLRRLRGNWFYPSEFPEKVAPLAALGMVNLMGRAHRISEIKENSTPSISGKCASPPFLVVAGAGHATLNGRYALAGNFAGKPKYKQVGGNSIIFFMSGKWRLNDEEVTDERCYDAVEVDEEARIPPSRWVKVNARYGAAPSLSLGTGRDLQVGDSVVLEKHSRSIDWSGCPEDDSSRRFSFSAPKTVTVHRLQGEWFYPAEFRTLVAPVAALGSVNFFGQAHRIEAEEEMMTSASSGENAPPLAAFLVLRGAGVGAMNGRYVQDGLEEEKPKYKQVGGNSIIYFSSGVWRLNDEENMQQRKYDGAQNDTPTPPNEWVQVDSNYGAAPKLSIGTWRDLQEGDTVTISKRHEDFDWSGCPVNSAGRLRFSPSSWTITVQRVQGDWFYPAEFETLIAPLAALGTVNLMGMACRISPVSAASRKPRDQNVADSKKGKIMGGYDEEWCAEQDVQRFKCAICLLVARAAMAHECGSDLFCEGCWEKCMSKDNKCPVCRNDGSTIVPAHFERRSIGNLKVMCPNKCGQSFPLYEKEHHLHDLCPCQQGVRADTMDADVEEDREVCSACAIS